MSNAASAPVSPLRWLGVIAVPFLVASTYLLFSRWPTRWFTAWSDYAALGVAVATFIVAVLALPLRRKTKLLIAVGSAPFLVLVLGLYALVFVGFAFGDWL